MLKALFGSGLRCAHPDCVNLIVEPGTKGAEPAVVGQICHIYASSNRGPRARPDLPPGERDVAENLILLCAHHHALVDRRPSDYPVETLRAWKRDQSEDRARSGPVRNSVGDLQRSAFFVEASDQVVEGTLTRLRQGRVFAGFPLRLEADALAERVGDGDLACASARVRAQALAWCARLIQHEDREAAKALVDASRRIAACTEGEIADAIVFARKDLPMALAALGKIDDPSARTAAFRLKCTDAGVASALDWAAASGLSDAEFDCDGRFFIVMAKLEIGDWDGAFASATTIAADDVDIFPALAHAAAMAFLATAVPAELRRFVLAQVPMGPLPLGAAAEIMEIRRRAVPLFERAAEAARSLGLDGAARNQDDYALWLRLYDPVSNEAAVADLARSMQDSEAAMRRVHLALQFGIEVDVVAFEKEVDRRVALTGGGTVTEAFALFALSQAKSDPRLASEAIGRHRALLYAHLEVKALRCVEIDVLAGAGMVVAARARLAEARVLGLDEPEAVRLERIIAEAEGRDPVAARSAAFVESGALLDLVALVQILEERHLWGELRSHAEELYRRTASIDAAKLVARVFEETGDWPSLMAFFDANPDLGSATDGLDTSRAWTQYREGRFADARVSVRALRDARNDPNDRALETNIAISSGEWSDLSTFVASEWRERTARTPDELLRAAQLAQAIRAPLAAELLAEAAERGRGDASILVAAYFQAVGAESEVDPRAADWLAEAAALSDESGPLRKMPFAELLRMMPEHIQQQEMVSAQIAEGGIPLPLAARLLGRSVLDIVLLPSFANLREPDLRRRMIVPVFSGARGDAPRSNCRTVALDVTSILLLGRLNLLASAIARYDGVLISHATLGWLFTERQKAEFHQPSRIKEAEEVSRLIAEGILAVMSGTSPANSPARRGLAADVGEDLAAMIDAATTTPSDGLPRRVVRPAPVMRIGAMGEEEVDLSAFTGVICGCSAVVDRLRASGALSANEERKARAFLRLQERSWPNDAGVPEGCEMFLDEVAVRHLQGAGLLAKLADAGLVIWIGPSIEEEAKRLLRLQSHLADVLGCIESIRRTLAEALRTGRVRVLGSSTGERLAEATLQPTSDVLGCLVPGVAVVCDDRFINRHCATAIADFNTPILTTLDVLEDLREGGVLSREAVFEHRTMLRRAGYALVPLEPDELIWFVEAARGPDGLLIATAELRGVRDSLLAIRMSGMLDVATEGGWLHRSLGSVAAAIKAAWRDDVDPAASATTCDWLLELLEVRGWVDAGAGDRAGRDGVRFQAMHILGLIASPPNVSATVAQAYHRWLDTAVLEEMAEAEPNAFDWVVARVRKTIDSCLTGSDPADDAGLVRNAVADALMRTFPARVGRLRMAGQAVPVALRCCARDHRHAVERLDLLRSQEPASRSMRAGGTKARQEAASASVPARKDARGWDGRQEACNGASLAPPTPRKLRCAVYTRKSSEEGLEQAFNSLDAQREACEAYILSQRAEGWLLVPDRYDDGGVSGGTLERPALRRLLADIEAGHVDVVVVYKIDRLSRALMDFARLVEVFDRHNVTFVSVTQAFNTTTSMGRLTLNVLLSFAQFEREVIGERIRDKFAASRRKGMWMGGNVPFGYVVGDRKLVIHEPQAATVRMIFERFARVGSATTLAGTLAREGVLTPRGKAIDKGWLYKLLTNRVYVGEAVHKGSAYPGEHQAIVTRALWDKVHAILGESPRKRAADTRTSAPALLKGLIFGPTGCAMSPTHTRKGGRLYRYYVSQTVLKQGRDACPIGRLPAAEIETAVIDQVRGLLRAPEIVVGTWRAARVKNADGISEDRVRQVLQDLDPLWDELFPAEQARIVQLLVERIDVGTHGFDLRLRVDGLAHLAKDLAGSADSVREAA